MLVIENELILRMLPVDVVEEARMKALEASDASEAAAILEDRPGDRYFVRH